MNSVVVSKTEATTNLVVQNGQTIMIGGLIREDVSDGKRRYTAPQQDTCSRLSFRQDRP